jgi:hypothetical protein
VLASLVALSMAQAASAETHIISISRVRGLTTDERRLVYRCSCSTALHSWVEPVQGILTDGIGALDSTWRSSFVPTGPSGS